MRWSPILFKDVGERKARRRLSIDQSISPDHLFRALDDADDADDAANHSWSFVQITREKRGRNDPNPKHCPSLAWPSLAYHQTNGGRLFVATTHHLRHKEKRKTSKPRVRVRVCTHRATPLQQQGHSHVTTLDCLIIPTLCIRKH